MRLAPSVHPQHLSEGGLISRPFLCGALRTQLVPLVLRVDLHPRRAPAGPVAAHPPSRTVFLTASRIAVYSLDLLGGQRRDVIRERAGHDLGIEALEQRNGGEPLPLRGSLAASRLSL